MKPIFVCLSLLIFAPVLVSCRAKSPAEIEIIRPIQWGRVPGKPIEEHLVTVTAQPRIQSENGPDYNLSFLVLPAAQSRPIKILYLPENHCPPWEPIVSKAKDKILTFTVWQTKMVSSHDDAGNDVDVDWECSIETIKDGNQVLYDARICEVHKTLMKRVELPVAHGTPGPGFAYFSNAATEKFPHGLPFASWGGCVVMLGAKEKGMAYHCDQCVAAYKKWEQEQAIKVPSTATPAPLPLPVITK
jgi:hypothetical protein